MLFYLNKFGYDTIYLPSQRSAESRLKDLHFDLAILDLMMEEDDSGLQLARKIKAISPEIPIILLTAITNETGYSFSQEFKNSPELLPIDKYCEKGIRPDVLNKIIEQLITIKNNIMTYNVLIVDDEEGIRMAIKRALTNYHIDFPFLDEPIEINVHEADSAEKALEILKIHP